MLIDPVAELQAAPPGTPHDGVAAPAELPPEPEPVGDPGLPPPALCEGTLLTTFAGEVPVQQLAPGVDVVLSGGRSACLRWLGRRAVLPGAMPAERRAAWWPVRIRRGAIAAEVPSRDVLVSPTLGLRLNGALVPAGALVDGVSILTEAMDAPVRYIQPEFDRHVVLLTAGLEVESYADRDDRNSFANAVDAPSARGPAPAIPRATPAARAAAREAVAGRSSVSVAPVSRSPDLRLLADGRVLAPVSVEKGLHSFQLSGPAQEVRLLSRSVVPSAQDPRSTDRRRLGVSFWWIRLRSGGDMVEVGHNDPRLGQGFHGAERDARWTDGFALLPASLFADLTGEIAVEVKIGATGLQYPQPPDETRRRALVIDETVPTPDRDAGSNVMVEHMRLLQSLGYAITFLPANLAAPAPYAGALADAGIELAVHPFYGSMEHLIGLRGPSFALAYVHRVTVAERMIPLLRRYAPQTRILFNNADLHFLRLQREAELTGAEVLQQEAEAMRRRELEAFTGADVSLVCSTLELELLREQVPQARTVYLPWVIGSRPHGEAGFADREGIMFLGGFAHRPNSDAVIWFVTEVMPLLRPMLPGVVLHVYGHAIPDEVQALAGADVVIEGHVAELAGAFARHRLSIAPLRFGAGFKGKLAESLAHGVPAVATGIAAEGTGLVGDDHLLVADDAGSFALAVAELHETPELWERLVAAGHRFVDTALSAELGRERLREALRLAGLA